MLTSKQSSRAKKFRNPWFNWFKLNTFCPDHLTLKNMIHITQKTLSSLQDVNTLWSKRINTRLLETKNKLRLDLQVSVAYRMCSPLQVLIKSWTWEKSVSKSGMFGMENFTNLYEGKVKTGSEYTSNFFYTVHESKKDCRLYKTVSTGTSFNLNTRGRNLDLCDILLSHEPRMHRYTKQKMTQSHSLDQ